MSHLRARHVACRGRRDRPRPLLPSDHTLLAATRAAQCGAACDTDRGSDPRRQRAGRRLVVAHALDRLARLPHRRRVTVVLNRIGNGVRRAHRAQVAAGRRRACAQYRRLSEGHSIDGRAWRDHATILLTSRSEGNTLRLAILLAVIVIVLVLCPVVFMLALQIAKRLGVTANIVASRLLGVLLAALAVQYVIDGVRAALAG